MLSRAAYLLPKSYLIIPASCDNVAEPRDARSTIGVLRPHSVIFDRPVTPDHNMWDVTTGDRRGCHLEGGGGGNPRTTAAMCS